MELPSTRTATMRDRTSVLSTFATTRPTCLRSQAVSSVALDTCKLTD